MSIKEICFANLFCFVQENFLKISCNLSVHSLTKKPNKPLRQFGGGVPDRSRTCNRWRRRPLLYPIELRVRIFGRLFSFLTRIADTLHYSKARSNCKTIETVAAGKILLKSRDGDAALYLSPNFLQFYAGMLVRRFDKKELLH